MTDLEFDKIWQPLICYLEALNINPGDRELYLD